MKRAVVTFTDASCLPEIIKYDHVHEVECSRGWLVFLDKHFNEIGGVPSKRVVSWRIEEVKD